MNTFAIQHFASFYYKVLTHDVHLTLEDLQLDIVL